jgi:hypothetical protein
VKGSEEFDSLNAPRNQLSPTAVMRAPKRLSGLRIQASSPVRMKAQSTTRFAIAVRSGVSSWSLANTRKMPPALPRSPRAITPAWIRRIALSKHSGERGSRKVRLGDEPTGAARGHELPELGRVATRREDDGRAVPVPEQTGRHLEAVEVGEPHVEQDDVGAKLPRRPERGDAGLRLADHLEPLRAEDGARRRPEAGVIVHDEDGRHDLIVSDR